jgi:hypothetical protein
MTLLDTPKQPLEACTHERRPGTTVCLRCRHAARAAARERFNRLALRGAAVVIVVGTFVTAGAIGASAIRGRVESRGRTATPDSASHLDSATMTASVDSGSVDSATGVIASQSGAVSHAPPLAPAPAGVPAAPHTGAARPILTPVLPAGQSELVGGVTALRGDTDVVVFFDTPEARTRRPEKFEAFVRTTLPMVYGAAVRNVLAKLPDGTIVGQGELLSELPKRGIRIPLDAAWMLRVFPETRPGQDGPLVVRYRVAVVPSAE